MFLKKIARLFVFTPLLLTPLFVFARLLDSCYNCGRSGTFCFWRECGHPQSQGHKRMRPPYELWSLCWALKSRLQVYISPLELGRDQGQYLPKSYLCPVPGRTVIVGRAQILIFLMTFLNWTGILPALLLHQAIVLWLIHNSPYANMRAGVRCVEVVMGSAMVCYCY